MCCKGVRQHTKKAAKAHASEMSGAGCCAKLSRAISRKRSADLQTENGIMAKFSLPGDIHSAPGRILRRRPADEEFCITPVKFSPVKDMGSLPFDLLIQVVCKLNHYELEPVSCVSEEFRQAVKIARETHFDYKTPDRMRLPICSLFLKERSANSASRGDSPCRRSAIPNAPKHEWKPQKIRLTSQDLTELRAELFPEGKKSKKSSGVDVVDDGDAEHTISTRPGIATNRVLFSEDELSGALSHDCI